jgi:hypothetical protein
MTVEVATAANPCEAGKWDSDRRSIEVGLIVSRVKKRPLAFGWGFFPAVFLAHCSGQTQGKS